MRKFMIIVAGAVVLSGCAHADEVSKPKINYAAMHSDYKVYNADTDSMADVDTAIARAQANGRKALIIMGANWCHDSRGMAARMARPEFQSLIADNYELVYVSAGTKPGDKTQNRAVSQRFGVSQIEGTPTVFIVRGDGSFINEDSAGYWRRADSIPADITYAYLDMYAKK